MSKENMEIESSVEPEVSISDLNEQMRIRIQKLEDLQSHGKDPFEQVKYSVTHYAEDIINNFDTLVDQEVCFAGRIMTKRGMGKASFCHVQDRTGQIQIFTKFDALGEERYGEWQKLDRGDWVGVRGIVMKTQKGEISIRNQEYTLLTKTLRPLPEKYHGLTNTDLRYRQRYLDMIMNPEVKRNFEKRSMIIRTIRNELDSKGFLEVETPILNVIPGGASARPFVTHHNALDLDLYLRIAPELYLKRLIVGGMEKVYEIGRQFRNEGIDTRHNPEFTLIEIYQAFVDYKDMMNLTEHLIVSSAKQVCDSLQVEWLGEQIDLSKPFRRLTMRDAVLEYAQVDFDLIQDFDAAVAVAKEHDITVDRSWSTGDIFNAFFERYAEEKLIQPTFIYDYPVEISPLTKKKPDNKNLTERFELFICGKEFANAYSELNDPVDQRSRFVDQLKKRELGDDEANRMDEDFCVAIEYGMPPTGGVGIGIDRLCMLLTGADSIRDVLLFPTMKPIK